MTTTEVEIINAIRERHNRELAERGICTETTEAFWLLDLIDSLSTRIKELEALLADIAPDFEEYTGCECGSCRISIRIRAALDGKKE